LPAIWRPAFQKEGVEVVSDEQAGEIRRQVVEFGAGKEGRCDNCRGMLIVASNPKVDDRKALNEIAGMDWSPDCPTCGAIAGILVPVLAERMSLDS
jgi:hypothetical protein